jgi:hypothetical protein
MIFDTFGSVFFVLLDFVGKTSFSFATEISYRSYRSESALICLLIGLKSQNSGWGRIDKGLMYHNVYSSITATTIESNDEALAAS